MQASWCRPGNVAEAVPLLCRFELLRRLPSSQAQLAQWDLSSVCWHTRA